ncbi:MAG: histidine triad family protein [Acidobacteriota bacterium]|jgi:histidine triad (HIT) family protein|nr:histidine triad family protein [Acidobacteriota bacterium]
MSGVDDCVFCKLLSGELEVSMVHQDETCSAFMDVQPVNTGHVLVAPNRHAPRLADLRAEEGAQMFRVAHRVAGALRGSSGIRCEGVNFFLADGEAAGQEVFHVHLHVFPRYAGDGFGLRLPPTYSQKPDRTELDETAAKIKDAFAKSDTTAP